MSLGIQNDKTPAVVQHAIRSDGDTIPFIAVGGEKIGDAVEIDAASQTVGIVSALTADYSISTAVAGDEIQLRIKGLAYVKKAAEAWTVGAYAAMAANEFSANATGAHLVISDAASGASHGLVLLNHFKRAAT